jgi:ParB/RepB/Spo0J family partition protein
LATNLAVTGLQTIPLASIFPNVNNPRKHFDQVALKELAKSIESHGVRQPILVRPDPMGKGDKKYELIVGERRWRASKLAGKPDIPAIVDVLSDREALEVMVIENQQRQDVSPLEEARGYQALMNLGADDKAPVHTAESIAAKVGKSVGYVYARMKLIALIPAAAEALDQGAITAGHAVLIARLQPMDQVKALFACLNHHFDAKTAFEPQTFKLGDLLGLDDQPSLSPEKALREWIQDNVNLKLKGVPWDLLDANLVPEAGACATCPKRSESNPALFSELTIKGEDTCFDPVCFKEKREAFVQVQIDIDRRQTREAAKSDGTPENPVPSHEPLRQLSEQAGYTKPKPDQKVLKAGQWLPAKKGECPDVEKGLIVRGEHAGEKKFVCCNGACKVHKHHLSGSSSGSGGGHDYGTEEFNRHKVNIRDAKKAIARRALVREILGKVGAKLPLALLREIVADRMRTDWAPGAINTLNLLGIKADKPTQKLKEMVEKGSEAVLYKLLVADFLDVVDHADDKKEREQLSGLAKSVGIKNPHGVLTREDDRVNKLQACRECGCTEESACEFYQNDRHQACSWKEPDLCSNPKCLERAKAKVQTPAKVKAKKV